MENRRKDLSNANLFELSRLQAITKLNSRTKWPWKSGSQGVNQKLLNEKKKKKRKGTAVTITPAKL
ncbi:hypothetical protein OUZ56_031177 [Daphnia magna]|uniref:Uncharacterized protein n=1 Tax=Daphnia magna TaxID=35525 RepID=A0ABQ9ZU06_9CRUS|nr:hypothetical protein OUZ56_031177 [Daphnia magna]